MDKGTKTLPTGYTDLRKQGDKERHVWLILAIWSKQQSPVSIQQISRNGDTPIRAATNDYFHYELIW